MTNEHLIHSLLCKAVAAVRENPSYIMAQHRYDKAIDEQYKITGGRRLGFFPSAGARQRAKKSDADATLLLRHEVIRLLDEYGVEKPYMVAARYVPDPNKLMV